MSALGHRLTGDGTKLLLQAPELESLVRPHAIMRQRTTFLHDADSLFDANQLVVTNDSLTVDSITAVREDRLTFSFSELPPEIWAVLKQYHELHVRWTSTHPYACIDPLSSRTPPGLHILLTPQTEKPVSSLCPLLMKIFGNELHCGPHEGSFIKIPLDSGRFASSASTQYFHVLPSLKDFVVYLKEKICPNIGQGCIDQASNLLSAQYLDVDFDRISQTFVITSLRDRPEAIPTWTETFRKKSTAHTIEVGVLANEKPIEPEELSLGGFLTVIGENDHPDPTLFSFPSRHHCDASSFTAEFPPTIGLHPSLTISFPKSVFPPFTESECALHAYLTLPSIVFLDQYQFSDPLYLESKNIVGLKAIYGELDLEAPDWAVEKWGSGALFELAAPPREAAAGDPWKIEIPTHLRYLTPDSGGLTNIEVPWPVVFWACPAEGGTKMSVNPFDRRNLGYDGMFGPRTMFYHLTPEVGSGHNPRTTMALLNIPVMDVDRTTWVESGTGVILLIGFLTTAWSLLNVFGAKSRRPTETTGQKKRV